MERQTKLELIPIELLTKAADCLKVMAHPVRLRIVDILMQGDFSVREIAHICEIPENQVCEHLRHMQTCGYLDSQREGRTVHYRITSQQLPSLIQCVKSHCRLESGETNNGEL